MDLIALALKLAVDPEIAAGNAIANLARRRQFFTNSVLNNRSALASPSSLKDDRLHFVDRIFDNPFSCSRFMESQSKLLHALQPSWSVR